jgi:flagellar hook-basal body complex protein FliE
MNNSDIGAVLSEMRRVAAQAASRPAAEPRVDGENFGNVLGKVLSEVNEAQTHAESAVDSFTLGEGKLELPEVMIAQQKARLSLEAVIQVRNRFVAAYEDIMNMPV